jgi:hypothetical protein
MKSYYQLRKLRENHVGPYFVVDSKYSISFIVFKCIISLYAINLCTRYIFKINITYGTI